LHVAGRIGTPDVRPADGHGFEHSNALLAAALRLMAGFLAKWGATALVAPAMGTPNRSRVVRVWRFYPCRPSTSFKPDNVDNAPVYAVEVLLTDVVVDPVPGVAVALVAGIPK